MNYKDLLKAREDFNNAYRQYFNNSTELYRNIAIQMYQKLDLPDGKLFTFQSNSQDHINIPEEWLSIKDGVCKVSFSLVIGDQGHIINFESKKVAPSEIEISVNTFTESAFKYNFVSEEQIKKIDFTDLVEFIGESYLKFYQDSLKRV